MNAMYNSNQNYIIKIRINLVAGQARHDNATNVIKEVPAFAGSDCSYDKSGETDWEFQILLTNGEVPLSRE